MTFETLTVERDGAVMTVRLNRPDKLNAINRRMHLDLQALCRQLADDFDTRVVILAGEGRAFSAGADTSEWGQPGPTNELELRSLSGIGSRTADALEGLGQISIAAVHGFAVGGAVVLAIACDLRVAGESAWFSIPEVELGIPLSWNALPRLAREYGLVTHLAPDGKELEAARDLAARIVAKPPLPVALTKASIKAIRRGAEMGDVAYSDGDLLLYSRLLQQRARRREKEKG